MRALSILLLLLSSVSFAGDKPMFVEQPGTRGILYAVHGKHAGAPTLYLFGTIHVGKSDVTPFSHAVLGALATTKRLALEADVSKVLEAANAMFKLGRYPAGDTLDAHLPKKLATDLHALLKREHIADAQIEAIRPWGVAAMLDLLPATRAGLDGSYAADAFLAAWAKENHVPIIELEGFDFQLQLMADIPEADQVELLADTVKEVAKPEATSEMKQLFDGWSRGDEKVVQTEIDKDKDKSPATQRFQKKLLDDRNVGMANKAEHMLDEPGDTFLAVGSAHLLGKKGIVALLRQRGYGVVPVR